MTDPELNLAIAELCGLSHPFGFAKLREALDIYKNRDDQGMCLLTLVKIPNYAKDLNAMHQAEAWAHNESGRGYEYDMALCKVVEAYETGMPCNHMRLYHATARQRAEAFIAAFAK